MLLNYFKIAYRNLLKNKGYTLLNILGLALGMASAILIFTYVFFEFSYDNFHKEKENTFRMLREATTKDGQIDYSTGSNLAMQKKLIEDWKQAGTLVPVHGVLSPQVSVLEANKQSSVHKFIEENEGIMVGPEFFEVFNFPFLIGKPSALSAPYTAVISKKFAIKYFGDFTKAIGRSLKINNLDIVQIVGVLADAPLNTDFPTNIIISYETKRKNPEKYGFGSFDDWGNTTSNDHFFVKLNKNYSANQANAYLASFTKKYVNKPGHNDIKKYFISNINDAHFSTQYGNILDKTVSKSKLWGIALVGLMIILMACINFINISTAIISSRIKEVAVRKTLGSLKKQLAFQFLSETFLVASISLIIGGFAAIGLKPLLTALFNFPEGYSVFSNPYLFPFLILILVVVTLLSGLYPSAIMANYSPIEAFREIRKSNWRAGFSLRKGLIVLQFSIAIFLILSTIVNLEQMKMLGQKDMGYIKEGVISFSIDAEQTQKQVYLRDQLSKISGVKSVSLGSDLPSSDNSWQGNFAYNHKAEDEKFNLGFKFIDGNFFETFGIKIIAGNPFPLGDTIRKYVVNETLLKKLNIKNPQDVIGHELKLGGNEWYPIVAVVKDFHAFSAKEENAPIAMTFTKKFNWIASVKLENSNIQAAQEKIKKVHDEVFPEAIYNGEFYDKTIQNYYESEEKLGLLYKTASGIAILIGCLGLLGMAAFMTQQRRKEIGIRKVMGANLIQIVTLVSKDFLVLVSISAIIGLPLAYYFSKQWLQGFVFRIDLSWTYFALTIGIALIVSLLSVSYYALNAALTNPIQSLKKD